MCMEEKNKQIKWQKKRHTVRQNRNRGRKGDGKRNMLFICSLGCKIYFLPIALKVYDVVGFFFQIIVWLKKPLLLQSEKSQKRDTNITANMTEYVDIVLSDLVFQCKQSKELIKSGLVTLTREILILRMCNYRYDYWWKGGKDNHYMSTVAILCLIMFDICRWDLTMS